MAGALTGSGFLTIFVFINLARPADAAGVRALRRFGVLRARAIPEC